VNRTLLVNIRLPFDVQSGDKARKVCFKVDKRVEQNLSDEYSFAVG
jgi:hypothetical protein